MTVTYQGVARLLVEYRKQTGESYADIAAKTGLGRSTIGFLINTPPPIRLDKDTIDGLHTGLGFPRDILAKAAWVTLGWDDTAEPELPDADYWLARRINALSPESRAAIEHVLTTFERAAPAAV